MHNKISEHLEIEKHKNNENICTNEVFAITLQMERRICSPN